MSPISGPRRAARLAAVVVALALVLTACSTSGDDEVPAKAEPKAATKQPTPSADPSAHSSAHQGGKATQAGSAPVRHKPLRRGEQRVTLRMPEEYTPSPPTGSGTDDYRCFLLDPSVAEDKYITGFNVLPDNPDVVHHVILFRVPPAQVEAAVEMDDSTPGQGWSCFGGTGLGRDLSPDDAPWLGAWAPGGTEQVLAKGFGERLDRGSRVVMQVHYNLQAGQEPDRSAAELRLAPVSDAIRPLQTKLLAAPVELPCRPQHSDGKLCDRAAALKDVKKRVGEGPGSIADLLHYVCGPIDADPVQSCSRKVTAKETVRGVAGHMHLLGRSIKVELNAGTSRARTLLETKVWDFDNQGSTPIKPVALVPGDSLKVTCRHDQSLRDRLPAFDGIPDKYVVWGEGTTDEMCLALLMVTRP